MEKLQKYAGPYAAFLLGIVTGWLVLILNATPQFTALRQEAALVKLVVAIATWITACIAHYTLTGDPSAVQPAPMMLAPEESEALTRLSVRLDALEARLDQIILTGAQHQHEPPTPPTPPAPIEPGGAP